MRADEWIRHWNLFAGMRFPDGSFPYAPGLRSAVEPTIHAVLAGLAGGVDPRELAPSIAWLSGRRNQDGSVPCSPEFPDQGLWVTAPWVVAMAKAGDTRSVSAAVEFLLSFVSITVQNTSTNDLDGSLTGWPWGKGAFSWVEPTAWSLLALEAAGKSDHPRVEEGRKLLLDRQIPAGGWNYGNKTVYGQELIPFADTTALALLALCERVPEASIERSIRFLETDAATQESPYGLALTGLALRRCRRPNGDAVLKRLEGCVSMMAGERLNTVHLGLALQALGSRGVLWE
ncbi:MAG TPA: terpene cyclase/mutase family protein [Candidatus Ozemobacteraceae bacterium]|nr:terpene cyclase/mutase family protein [Candidatus Ozemobacteraceae bacterium]